MKVVPKGVSPLRWGPWWLFWKLYAEGTPEQHHVPVASSPYSADQSQHRQSRTSYTRVQTTATPGHEDRTERGKSLSLGPLVASLKVVLS